MKDNNIYQSMGWDQNIGSGGDGMKAVVTLSVDECPHGIFAISVNLRGKYGHRFTSSECCGRWDMVREWPMSKRDLQEAAKELLAYAKFTT